MDASLHPMRISIHALREEGDGVFRYAQTVFIYFYPRPPRGGRPMARPSSTTTTNFYPRPPRGGRPAGQLHRAGQRRISIHALREEGDRNTCTYIHLVAEFLSTPSARRATEYKKIIGGFLKFLSTPSARRATSLFGKVRTAQFISIHALREEGDLFALLLFGHVLISIHALREEGDAQAVPCWNVAS